MRDRIETARLVLRPFSRDDGEAVVTWLGDFAVSRWLGQVPHPYGPGDLRITGPDGEGLWPEKVAITRAGDVVGGMGIGDHLGFWVARPAWGQGIATEAAGALCRHHFETTAARELRSGYFEGNTGSARVLEKLGFVEIGRRAVYSASNRRALPHVDLALPRARWERLQ